jgi:histidyl-tRNA synthetase
MPIELVKGFRDVLPPESLKRQKIKEIIEKNFKLFGFLPIETPTIEYEELAKGDNERDSAVSDRFRLTDRGNRDLSLRYEFTFQLKRIFKENPNIKLPFRRYQIGNVFRDEPVEKDRYREFIQCDADIIGDTSIKADAECLAVTDKICKELKIDYKLIINNRKLINDILKRLEISDVQNVLREIDKIPKIGEDAVKQELIRYADKSQIFDLFKVLQKDISFFAKEKFRGAEEILELLKICKGYGINAIFSPYLIRGFSYYTGNIFEGYSDKIKGSLFGGGRYDSSIGRYTSKEIPAVGNSIGRLLDYPDIKINFLDCLLISIGQDEKTMNLMNKLRDNSVSCFMMDKISKALEYANSYSIPFVVFIGEDEVKKKKFKLRNMKTGKEQLLGEKELIKNLIEK